MTNEYKNLLAKDHPRLRGEYQAYKRKRVARKGSPPLARGIQNVIWTLYTQFQDHPRLRGEYESEVVAVEAVAGSPPLARGILTALLPCQCSSQDHPRLRGEYGLRVLSKITVEGSPPLARGIHRQAILSLPNHGITPACAGNTPYQYQ